MFKAFSGISVLYYALAVAVVAVSFYVKSLVSRLFQRHLKRLAERTTLEYDDILVDAARVPASWAAVVLAVHLALVILGLEARLNWFLPAALGVLGMMLLLSFIDRFIDHLKTRVKKTDTSLDDAILPAVRTAAKIFVIVVAVLWILGNFGYSINSILAGLGIGGLAVALAAQSTLSNWFGAVTIFTDRPFAAGDRVKIGEVEGTVEQVDLRSTRVRTYDGALVTIPNSSVAGSHITNISRMPSRRSNGIIGLAYDTSPEKVEEALGIIRDVLFKESEIQNSYVVSFEDFGAYALNIRVIYWTQTVDYVRFLAIKERVNLEIMRRFLSAGVEMAFPTQTVYVKTAGGAAAASAPENP